MSLFSKVPLAPPDPILGLSQAFASDPRPHKVNLGVGLFKDEHLKTPRLQTVKKAEIQLAEQGTDKTYLPIEGHGPYLEQIGKLTFGDDLWQQHKDRIAAFQTPGGTGALAIGAAFLKEEVTQNIAISSPSWPNHRGVFSAANLQVHNYPYYDFDTKSLLIDQMQSTISSLPSHSSVVLQASCHNPTGLDLSQSQRKSLFSLLQERELLPFFDMAYQGLGHGIDQDAEMVRDYLATGKEMLVAISNAKNFSLYAERVGALFIVCSCAKEKEHVLSRVKQIIRVRYSNPPAHGARVVATILSDASLRSLFFQELEAMRQRLVEMRKEFSKGFPCKQVQEGIGMFGFLGLREDQVKQLIEKEAIYMPSDGRINVCGLTAQNIPTVIKAIEKIL